MNLPKFLPACRCGSPHPAGDRYHADLAEIAPLYSWGGTAIGWTGHTLNCIVGCEKVSRACKHCYAANNKSGPLASHSSSSLQSQRGR
jgi:hypothetical protein